MKRHFAALALSVLIVVVAGAQNLTAGQWTTIDVSGEQVRIYRDEYSVPHIFGETNRGVFVAYGYTVAQDRLWQLEMNRRTSRGRLAEIFGVGSRTADRNTRMLGYTDTELNTQFGRLTSEEQETLTAYVDGINRYITEVVAPDPDSKLPFEFHSLNIGVPALWTIGDVVAWSVRRVSEPPNSGLSEMPNQTLLTNLIKLHRVGERR